MESVEYRAVYGDEGYRIGDDGSLWTRYRRGPNGRKLRPWKQCKPTANRQGYLWTALILNGSMRRLSIHRLVLEHFVGPCPTGKLCRHLNGTPGDNRLSNLAWGTPVENSEDRKAHGTFQIGETTTNAKLTNEQVLEIIRRRRAGEKLRVIAAAFGVHNATISRIATGNQWPHLSRTADGNGSAAAIG